MQRELLTTNEAAEFLGVSPITLRKQRVEGARDRHLPLVPWCRLSPRCVRYKREALIRYVEDLEVRGESREA